MRLSVRVGSIECSLSLEVHSVGQRPKGMGFDSVAGDLVDLAREAGIIKERDVGEAMLLEIVSEGRVAGSDGAGENGNCVNVLADEVFELRARHICDISIK